MVTLITPVYQGSHAKLTVPIGQIFGAKEIETPQGKQYEVIFTDLQRSEITVTQECYDNVITEMEKYYNPQVLVAQG